jgi:hypothetical protein
MTSRLFEIVQARPGGDDGRRLGIADIAQHGYQGVVGQGVLLRLWRGMIHRDASSRPARAGFRSGR